MNRDKRNKRGWEEIDNKRWNKKKKITTS